MSNLTTIQKLVILFVAYQFLVGGGIGGPAQKPTAAVYIHEKDATPVPAPVRAALNQLNRQGLVATEHEEDTTDGTDAVPEQYKLP